MKEASKKIKMPIVLFHLYKIVENASYIVTESPSVVAWGWGPGEWMKRWITKSQREIIGNGGNLMVGDGFPEVYICQNLANYTLFVHGM